MALHGFADLEASVLYHTALAAIYDINDQKSYIETVDYVPTMTTYH
jgi:hypothetical protein